MTPHTTVGQDIAVAGFNFGAWLAAVVTWADIGQATSLFATAAAVTVSIASLLWIKKQSREATARQVLQLENLKLEREVLEKKLAHGKAKPASRSSETSGFGE